MKLSKESKNQLLFGIDNTYKGFIALDCSETAKIFEGYSLKELAHSMIDNEQWQRSFQIGDKTYMVSLEKPLNGAYRVKIDPTNKRKLLTFDQFSKPEYQQQIVDILSSQVKSLTLTLKKSIPTSP